MGFQVRVDGPVDDPYAPSLQNMAELVFPGSAVHDPCAVFEAVSHELVGTKQHRFGPTPDPESLVAIREVVREAMEHGAPIPILIPWGASKQGPYGVDVAEMMALKQLICLNQRVRSHYAPGVDVGIRLEDLTDSTMFRGIPGWAAKTSEYVAAFVKLHNMMVGDFSTVQPESELMDGDRFRAQTESNAQVIFAALGLPPDRRGPGVKSIIPEWSGDLPDVQLDFYRRAYDKFYPNETREQKDGRLATYFGGAISRFQLGGTGARRWRGAKYITLSFTGIPWSKAGRRIYYRTVPERYTNQHRAPWIGKGYIRIRGREASPAIAGFNGDDLQFTQSKLVISNSDTAVAISADYVVME